MELLDNQTPPPNLRRREVPFMRKHRFVTTLTAGAVLAGAIAVSAGSAVSAAGCPNSKSEFVSMIGGERSDWRVVKDVWGRVVRGKFRARDENGDGKRDEERLRLPGCGRLDVPIGHLWWSDNASNAPVWATIGDFWVKGERGAGNGFPRSRAPRTRSQVRDRFGAERLDWTRLVGFQTIGWKLQSTDPEDLEAIRGTARLDTPQGCYYPGQNPPPGLTEATLWTVNASDDPCPV